MENQFDQYLEASAALHHHLCPRQVLGVRMGIFAQGVLNLDLPQADKRLLTIVETDGCFADGVSVATGCWMGRRTMRVEDFGKVAATFVDTHSEFAVRVAPLEGVRVRAARYAPPGLDRWHAQLIGYQNMPGEQMFTMQEVTLLQPVSDIVGDPESRTACDVCGEEIINLREVIVNDILCCRACAGQAYYTCGPPHLKSQMFRETRNQSSHKFPDSNYNSGRR